MQTRRTMGTGCTQDRPEARIASRSWACRMLALAVAIGFMLMAGAGRADKADDGRFCSATAAAQFAACQHEGKDGFFTAKAICINVSDRAERRACFAEATAARQEGRQRCHNQHTARKALCAALGEGRYDPKFAPENFVNVFMSLNPYFPLQIGNTWEYEASDETNTIEVLSATKRIEGVTCIVVRDIVSKAGGAEHTDDWYAQATNGDVHYCGEEVKNFETFVGDNPMALELVSSDGSFKAGRHGDRSGIIFLGSPVVGRTYRQEFSAGNAEDAATVLSTHYVYGNDSTLDGPVPPALGTLCSATYPCVVTREFTPIEPDVFGLKYYARGIGLFLEVDPATGKINQLVGCNVDPRCPLLPTP